jgi:hypothetical protein
VGPGAEVVLVDVEPMLLGTDYHAYSISSMLQGGRGCTWSEYSHEGNDFDGCESIFVNQVCADKTSCPSQTGFTMHCNDFYSLALCSHQRLTLFIDNTLCFNQELFDGG